MIGHCRQERVDPATDILDLVHESVVTYDVDGTILSWNRASEALYGRSREARKIARR